MVKIINANPENRSLGYEILLGKGKMAEVASKIQSAVITMGSHLGQIVFEPIRKPDMDIFIKGQNNSEKAYFGKEYLQTYKKKPTSLIKYKIPKGVAQPSGFLFIGKTVYICRIRLGYTFDSGKSQKEFQNLRAQFKLIEPLIKEYGCTVKPAFACLMPPEIKLQETKQAIHEGCKKEIPLEWLYSIEELYKKAELNYDALVKVMEQDQKANQEYLIDQFTNFKSETSFT